MFERVENNKNEAKDKELSNHAISSLKIVCSNVCKMSENYILVHLKLKPRGVTQICRCTHAWTMVLKYIPKHILVKMQNSPPEQGYCGILSQIWPLIGLSLKDFDKTSPFFWNMAF